MSKTLIGRKKEQETLQKAWTSDEAEMIAVIGRRRVGKTFLIRTVYQHKIDIEFMGVQNASRAEQLASFHFLLSKYGGKRIALKTPDRGIARRRQDAWCNRKSPRQNTLYRIQHIRLNFFK